MHAYAKAKGKGAAHQSTEQVEEFFLYGKPLGNDNDKEWSSITPRMPG
jgi:hypothetical protein